jgi:hypothetical protein
MSIKYLQDQQLNQVQQSPNNSPWAKLIAQSEMLERNKMRQPQGQAPQGTVAGNIQQQLMAAQEQEGERQNADLYKSQMLAQLIGSGQIPANFMSSSQGYADGGLTQPSMQPGTGAYRGIMMPNQPPQMQGQRPTYTPPNSQDPAAQEKKHGMLQSMLDNSIVGMVQGKANIGNAMQDYADLFSGKVFSRGFAEGGDVRGFVEGGSLFGYDPNLNSSGLDPRLLEAQDAENAARLRATEMVRKMHLGDAANKGVLSQLERDTHPMVKRLMEQEAQNANNLKATEMVRKMQLGQAANQGVIPETPVPKTTASMAETMAEAIRANKEYIPKTPNPTAGMNESMARTSAENAARMEAAKAPVDDWLKPKAGEAPYKSAPGMVEKGLGAIKKGLGSLGTHAGELLSEAAVPMDVYGASKTLVGNPFPLAYQAITGNKAPDIFASGELPDILSGVNFNAPSEKAFNPNSPISATGANDYESLANLKPNDMQRVTDRLKGLWGGDANSAQPDAGTVPPAQIQTPTTPPQTATAQTPSASPTQGAIYKDNGVTRPKNSVTVTPDKRIDLDVMSNAHKQPDVQPSQVSEAAQKVAAAQQAISAIERRPNEEGQGSILDSLYSKLKDSDVDYSDLAKRISQNEYDLARERKDGTLNAILGGVGAALTQAGTYQGVGDRVFKPGLGTIAGAGIMGGLKMSAASDEAISKKSQDNMTAMIALKKLKRESMNDVLDAISAQKQVDAITRGQDITAGTHAATNKLTAAKVDIEGRMADIAEMSANADMLYKQAQAKKLDIEGIVDQKDKMLLEALNKQLGDQVTLLNGAAKDLNLTPEQRQGYQARLDSTQSQLNDIYAKYQSFAPKVVPSGADYSDPSYRVKSVTNR